MFMNLLIYLICGLDKSFDMQSLKALVKGYKFFYDGFIKNVWMHECLLAMTANKCDSMCPVFSCLCPPQLHM